VQKTSYPLKAQHISGKFLTDLTVHKMLKKPAAKHVTPVSESSWCSHLHNVFRREPVSQFAAQTEQHRHVRRWTGTESAMDSLIQLGRRHNNAQPLGPHPFNMPEDDELRTLVATHIPGINI